MRKIRNHIRFGGAWMKLLQWSTALLLIFITFSPGVTADIRPPNTAETQLISTLTSVKCVGAFTETDSLVWRQSNEALDVNLNRMENYPLPVEEGKGDWIYDEQLDDFIYVGPGNGNYILPYPNYPLFASVLLEEPEPPLAPDEVQITSSTRENTLADHGKTVYAKRSLVDTNWKTANMYNVNQEKMVGFSGMDTGKITSDESALIDSVGMTISIEEQKLWYCPLNCYTQKCLPPFCNVVETGSSLDMKEVQFTTSIKSRNIAEIANEGDEGLNIFKTMPVIDGPPTELAYTIGVNGISPVTPARGAVEAYIRVHAMEGAEQCPSPCGGQRLDLVYREKTTAAGYIEAFQKNMHYTSGIRCAGFSA